MILNNFNDMEADIHFKYFYIPTSDFSKTKAWQQNKQKNCKGMY